MLPHELSALPVGTRVKLSVGLGNIQDFDYGVIAQTGVTVLINWDEHEFLPEGTYVDTASSSWTEFIRDIYLENAIVPPPAADYNFVPSEDFREGEEPR